MELLLVLLLLLYGPIWIFHLPKVDGIRKLPLSFISASVPSPEDPPPFPSTAAFSPGTQVGSEQPHKMEAIIVSFALLGSITLCLLCLWICHGKALLKSHQKEEYSSEAAQKTKHNYLRTSRKRGVMYLMDHKMIEMATKNFHESNILEEAGFGCTYKARLDDNVHVAVKRIAAGSQDTIAEFEIEVDMLSKMQHPNIISLLGYSIHGETRLLVHELMNNGSLETQLHGPSRGSALTWFRRMKIAVDMARGLEYLHEHCNPPVIHRDLKSSNVLLDSSFNAKLSDFGRAITDGTQNKKNIKFSGTLGYVAPEYLLDGELSEKSDVYGFGVILLELLLGRKPVEKVAPVQCQSIVTWAMPQLVDRSKLPKIVDPVIRNTMDPKQLFQVAAVAVLCVQPEPSYRPLITDVLHSLIPLVPIELGGTLKTSLQPPSGR